MDIVIYGYSDNLDKNYVSPPLSLYPLCTVYTNFEVVVQNHLYELVILLGYYYLQRIWIFA